MRDWEKFIAGLHDYISRALKPLADRLKEFDAKFEPLIARLKLLEERPPPQDGKDGTSVTIDDVKPLIEAAVEAIPKPKDGEPGKDGVSVDVDAVMRVLRGEIKEVLDLIPVPKDGKSVTVDEVLPALEEKLGPVLGEKLAQGLVELRELCENLVKSLPKPKDGKDGADGRSITLEDVAPVVAEIERSLHQKADEALAKVRDGRDGANGKDGKDGTSVTTEEIRPIVQELVDAIPRPKDGKDGQHGVSLTPDDVAPMLQEMVSALPKAKDGTSVTVEDVRPMLQEMVDAIPKPKDGKNGTNGIDGKSVDITEVMSEVTPIVQRYLDALPKPRDGKDVTVEDIKEVLAPLVATAMLDIERRGMDMIHRCIERIEKPKDGKDGRDGLGFDDIEITYDGRRTFNFGVKRGDVTKDFPFKVPFPLEDGVHVRNKAYERGDCVTSGGSYWIALRDTVNAPGEGNDDWRLVVRKGRDGKDLRDRDHPRNEKPVVRLPTNGGAK